MVDGHGEGGFVVVGVLGDHLGKRQLLAQFGGHGHADEPLAVYCHEVHVLGGGELRCADEIAFVLAVGVVGAQNDLDVYKRQPASHDGLHPLREDRQVAGGARRGHPLREEVAILREGCACTSP